uniref:Tail fiber protein n=1 Tax=Siphoviridae sp. ct3ka12 TaxID=2827771 RepID=A0A8S5SM57_9CAUD|nr:MAG TPA: hypothetical protein [Siphoviridae sp. ct3ka12]
MTAIENIINQIENETRRFGNTKTRVAAVLRLIKTKLIDLFSGKLDKGRYTGSADDLNNAIGNKVDKVPGKILSSNDFTNELRTKLEGLQNVDISQLLPKGGYTGTAQNLKELIDNIMRILQSPDTELDELREIVAFIKQNKRTLDTLGIDNIAGLRDALNGKSPNDHHHDDRYSRLGHTHTEYALRTHTHSEYAPKNHRHNWNDIDGKPELVTEEKIKAVVKNVKIGGRNYALNSKNKKNLVGYVGAYWELSEPAVVGKTYTFSCYANIENGRRLTMYFVDVHGQPRQYIVSDLVNGYNQTSVTPNYAWTGLCAFHEVSGISPTPTATIEKVKFEIGDKATDWSPAPEDIRIATEISGERQVLPDDNIVYVTANTNNCDLQLIPSGYSVAFRKVFAGGQVTFTCLGKQIIYTGDTAFNGGDGSTAVVSIWNNKCYIDIRNI